MARTAPATGAANQPVRSFGGANSQAGRAEDSNFGNAGARGNPAMGRPAQTGAPVNRDRPPSAQGSRPQSHMLSAPADSGGNRSLQGIIQTRATGPRKETSPMAVELHQDLVPPPETRIGLTALPRQAQEITGPDIPLNPQSFGSSNRPDHSPSPSYTNDRGSSAAPQRRLQPRLRARALFHRNREATQRAPAADLDQGPPAPSRSYAPPSHSSSPRSLFRRRRFAQQWPDRMAEETSSSSRGWFTTRGAANRIHNLRLSLSLFLVQQAHFFACRHECLFSPTTPFAEPGYIPQRHKPHQVNPVWKLKQSPDVGIPESGAMV